MICTAHVYSGGKHEFYIVSSSKYSIKAKSSDREDIPLRIYINIM